MRVLLPVLLCGLTALAYAPLRHNDFVSFDDNKYTYENPHLSKGLSRAGLAWAFLEFHDANWFPLTALSLLLDYEIWELDPFGYHLTNLLLHLLSTVLLYAALRRMTGATWRSAFVAGVFALHPLHVESVAWAAERKDALSGAFWMLTVFCYARYATAPSAWRRYLPVVGCLALGLMSKATLVTLPFVLLLLDAWPLARLFPRRQGGERRLSGAVLVEKIPLLVLAALSSAVTFLAQQSGGAVRLEVPFSIRVANAVSSCATYLEQAFWPRNLTFFYPHRAPALHSPEVLLSGLAIALVSVLAVATARRLPAVLVGWLWYLGTLVPMLGFVQVGLQARADRYTYVPLVGLAISVAWGAEAVSRRLRLPRPALGAVGAGALVACAILTWQQVQVWRDNHALFRHALSVDPENYMAHYSLGYELVKEQRYAEAERHLRSVVRQQPDWKDARANLGVALLAQGRSEEAIVQLSAALQADPRDVTLRLYLARAHLERGALRSAERTLVELLRLVPGLPPAHVMLIDVHTRSGRLEDALRSLEEVDRIHPEWPVHPDAASLAAGLLEEAAERGSLDAASRNRARRLAERLAAANAGRAAASDPRAPDAGDARRPSQRRGP